jgi:excisionase family DNA binding protein
VEDLADVLLVARALVAAGLGSRRESEPAERDDRPPLTVPEAAGQLRVHESTLYRAIQDGILGAYSVGSGGRAIRIPAAELDAFKARKRIRRQEAVPAA